MHEFSLAQQLVKMVQDCLPSGGGQRVRVARLQLGELSDVTPGALAAGFDLASIGTPIEGVQLEIEMSAGNELRLVALELVEK